MDHPRVRETTEQDEAVVLQLMTEYMTWALATFEQTYGFATGMDARHTSADLDKFRRPSGLLALARADGGTGATGGTGAASPEPAGVAALHVHLWRFYELRIG